MSVIASIKADILKAIEELETLFGGTQDSLATLDAQLTAHTQAHSTGDVAGSTAMSATMREGIGSAMRTASSGSGALASLRASADSLTDAEPASAPAPAPESVDGAPVPLSPTNDSVILAPATAGMAPVASDADILAEPHAGAPMVESESTPDEPETEPPVMSHSSVDHSEED